MFPSASFTRGYTSLNKRLNQVWGKWNLNSYERGEKNCQDDGQGHITVTAMQLASWATTPDYVRRLGERIIQQIKMTVYLMCLDTLDIGNLHN